MDANGTRYHLLLGKQDWASCTDITDPQVPVLLHDAWYASPANSRASALAWDERRMELTLQPRLLPATPTKKVYPLSLRRGADRDRYGNWYWISETGQELLVNSVGTGSTSHFWSADDTLECVPAAAPGSFQPVQAQAAPIPLQLSGLAVTEDHYLVVGVLDPAGLLIFDLHAGGAPRQLYWPGDIPFVPFDIAPMPGGGVWILDSIYKRYWALDRFFNVLAPDAPAASTASAQPGRFQPRDGHPAQAQQRVVPRAGSITLDAAFPLAVQQAIAIEALPDGSVLILDRNPDQDFSLIYHYRFKNQLGLPVSTAEMKRQIEPEQAANFRLRAYDFAFVPEHDDPDSGDTIPDLLYVVAEDGLQSYAFIIFQQDGQLSLQPQNDYLPMRLFSGKALVATKTQAYYDLSDQWIPLIRQPRPRYETEGTLQTPSGIPRPAFDGREPDCVWHRLMLDACIPQGAEVQVWSRATNDPGDLLIDDQGWQQEPPLYLRGDGSELPFVAQSRAANSGTWELLLQHAQGRYLQIKLKLSGNGRMTPRIRAMRIYYPRFSYLEHYLPAVYREDSDSASFLDRFLANIEGFYTAIEDKIAHVYALFTVASTPAEALEWLAGWFGIALDPSWSELKQRLFLNHAMDFFRYRGTIRGLQMALQLALEKCPGETIFTDTAEFYPHGIRIVEKYRTRYAPAVVFGDPTDLAGPRAVVQTQQWTPDQGEALLTQRYRTFLQQHGQDSSPRFPLTAPVAPDMNALWRQFAKNVLGFIPVAIPGDEGYEQLWQDFLRRRYQTVAALNIAYKIQVSDFGQVPLFTLVPPGTTSLQDWYQFESIVLAMYGTAHRFTVLLPNVGSETNEEQQQRRSLAERIINLEKPAHTIFDVKFYWAFFRVGAALLGEDTLLDLGSRSPQLMPPTVLEQGYLSESYVAAGHPQNVPDRYILGRNLLNG